MTACPDCTHPKTDHSALMGCLADAGACECDRSFKESKTPERAEAEKVEAMDRAERGTDAAWAVKAEEVIRFLAGAGGEFQVDDVWEVLEDRKVPPPREPRALGPVVQRLVRARVIKPEGFDTSNRRHKAIVRTYVAGPEL